jgi:hypothetical protein
VVKANLFNLLGIVLVKNEIGIFSDPVSGVCQPPLFQQSSNPIAAWEKTPRPLAE